MTVFKTISEYDFRDAFFYMRRKEQFSYEGLGALFNYLDAMDEMCELDVIALCCAFTEVDIEEFIAMYPDEVQDPDADDALFKGIEALGVEYIEIPGTDRYIIRNA